MRKSLLEMRALAAIAWPMLIAQLALIGTGVVDTVMAGHYGREDLAAIAIGYNYWLPIFLFFVGLMLGASTIVAQQYGAGKAASIRQMLAPSIWLALITGLLAVPLCYFADPVLQWMELAPSTHDKSLDYLQAVAFGMPAAAIFQALRCHTQGIGILRPFAIASVLGFVINIPLNYALIYGAWGAPELGAAGCGWATAISMWLAPLLIAYYIKQAKELRSYLPPVALVKPHWPSIWEIARLGLPIGASFFLEVAVFSVIAFFIAGLGNTAIGAHQIAFNIWDLVYVPLICIGSAMATRIGHSIGAADKPAALRSIRCGVLLCAIITLACVVLLLIAPQIIIRAYTSDADIHLLAIYLLRLAALFILVDAAQMVASFCLRAFKDTRFPFLVLSLAHWLLTLPLGYYLGVILDGGTEGFWHSMIVGIALASTLIVLRLRWILTRPLLPA